MIIIIIQENYGTVNVPIDTIDITAPDLYQEDSVSAGVNWTVNVTDKPRIVIYHCLINNVYSFTYIINVEKETVYRIGTYTSYTTYWHETRPYSDIVYNIDSSSVVLKASEFSNLAAKVVTLIYY